MGSLWVIALVYPVVIATLFYFAFLRPVQQERKKQRQQLQSLRVGDEVLTQSGFIAVVKDVRIPEEPGPTEVILDLGGIEVRAVASAIVERLNAAEAPEDDAANQRQTMEARG
jgi:preprotein translocase YajC subunit